MRPIESPRAEMKGWLGLIKSPLKYKACSLACENGVTGNVNETTENGRKKIWNEMASGKIGMHVAIRNENFRLSLERKYVPLSSLYT